MSRFLNADQLKITVSSLPGDWEIAEQPKISREVSKKRPAAGAPKAITVGRPDFEDIPLTRMYDPDRDPAICRAFAGSQTYPDTTVTIQALDQDGTPIAGSKQVWTGCVMIDCTPPKSDANASDPAEMMVTFAVGGLA